MARIQYQATAHRTWEIQTRTAPTPELARYLIIMKLHFIIAFTGLLAACSNNQRHNAQENLTESNKIRPLEIIHEANRGWGADIRLSIIEKTYNASLQIYKAVSSYNGHNLGLNVTLPKTKEGNKGFGFGAMLTSLGEQSDYLLQSLADLYKQRIDANNKFKDTIEVNFVNLKEFAESTAKNDSGPYQIGGDYKLFFEDEEGNEAELYININSTENWLELREKDQAYRPLILKFLSR